MNPFSAIDVSSKEDVEMSEPKPVVPSGVEDFDDSCKNDPYSVPDYAVDIFNYYRQREVCKNILYDLPK